MIDSLHHGLGSVLVILWMGYVYLSFFSRVTGDIFLFFDPVGRHALSRRHKGEAAFFALALLLLLGFSAYEHFWIFFTIIMGYLVIFAISIHYPQLKDRWQMRSH